MRVIKKKKKVKVKRKRNVERTNKGWIKKGQVLNPKGRPQVPEVQLLREAVAAVGIQKKKSFYALVAERAYEDNTVLIALLRKFTPDLKSMEGVIANFEASMSDELAQIILGKLRKRYQQE